MRNGTARASGARRPLVSFLLLGLAALSVMSTTTWASFSDSSEGRGVAKAGTIDVIVNDDPDDMATFTFTGPACQGMAYGESCTAEVTVRNAGTLVATYNVRVVDSGNDCFTSRLSSEATLESGPRPPGDSVTGTLTTTLDNDAARCQGLASNAVVVVGARQARNPHPR